MLAEVSERRLNHRHQLEYMHNLNLNIMPLLLSFLPGGLILGLNCEDNIIPIEVIT